MLRTSKSSCGIYPGVAPHQHCGSFNHFALILSTATKNTLDLRLLAGFKIVDPTILSYAGLDNPFNTRAITGARPGI